MKKSEEKNKKMKFYRKVIAFCISLIFFIVFLSYFLS